MKLKSKFITKTPADRLYQLPIPVIALTGGIATGKSSVSRLLLEAGHPLLDADKLVKIVYQKEKTLEYLKAHHPEVLIGNDVQFRLLRELFFKDKIIKSNIENLIYSQLPQVFHEELHKLSNPAFVIYDIPLLFERSLQSKFDLSILVYTTPEIQIERLMSRDNHTEIEARNIIAHQISIEEKKKKADLIISNIGDLSHLENEVKGLCLQLFEN